jgi:uncharacterized NAD(P)/FAD-binding protein YdhS
MVTAEQGCPRRVDAVVVGFGYAGLATLLHLTRLARRMTVAVISPEHSGLGLAYSTPDVSHLLNGPADRMGAISGEPGHFAAWLETEPAVSAGEALGIALPGPSGFAPRALYARYLQTLRETALRAAAVRGIDIRWVTARADSITPSPTGWVVRTADEAIEAPRCVVAIGNDPRRAFGALRHADLHRGPWSPSAAPPRIPQRPVVLIGSGLTAVDTTLSLRRVGYEGEILALSRSGRFNEAHLPSLPRLELEAETAVHIRSLSQLLGYLGRQHALGHDWRAAIDALRPYTAQIWQQFPAADQREAVRRWSSTWSLHRHRMAPEVAERIRADVALSVAGTRAIDPIVTDGRLELAVETHDGRRTQIRPVAVVDCVGVQLDCRQSTNPVVHGLLERGICSPHPTGLGFTADAGLEIADHLYAIGSALTGQLWETIAIPELRDQANQASPSRPAQPRLIKPTGTGDDQDPNAPADHPLRARGPPARGPGALDQTRSRLPRARAGGRERDRDPDRDPRSRAGAQARAHR